jgi:cytochrome c peroxidase
MYMCGIGLWNSFQTHEAESRPRPPAEYKLKIPFGLEETSVVIPADNPLTNEKIELGRLLFFDKRLSQDNTIACANCHLAKFAFTDGKPVSTGIRGRAGGARRHPSTGCSVARTLGRPGGNVKINRSVRLRIRSSTAFNYDVMAKMMKIAG